jgi:hypothetical protein
MFRSRAPVGLNSCPRILIPKIFDRGVLGLQTVLINRYLKLRGLGFSSYTHVYKIVILATL